MGEPQHRVAIETANHGYVRLYFESELDACVVFLLARKAANTIAISRWIGDKRVQGWAG